MILVCPLQLRSRSIAIRSEKSAGKWSCDWIGLEFYRRTELVIEFTWNSKRLNLLRISVKTPMINVVKIIVSNVNDIYYRFNISIVCWNRGKPWRCSTGSTHSSDHPIHNNVPTQSLLLYRQSHRSTICWLHLGHQSHPLWLELFLCIIRRQFLLIKLFQFYSILPITVSIMLAGPNRRCLSRQGTENRNNLQGLAPW